MVQVYLGKVGYGGNMAWLFWLGLGVDPLILVSLAESVHLFYIYKDSGLSFTLVYLYLFLSVFIMYACMQSSMYLELRLVGFVARYHTDISSPSSQRSYRLIVPPRPVAAPPWLSTAGGLPFPHRIDIGPRFP